ncbi:hypothetical protein [Methylocystis iwaonis]|uniref:hypothetical protein n=1 Tax=Methylocystis iwaonis TaxID=2885079 RepID=UPI002E7B92BD|nr:hypothetical protein [Methylocystis iwaonis]
MPRPRKPDIGKHRVQVDFSPDDFVRLEQACAIFGLGKSDLLRRLVRASIDVGPALSVENGEALAATTRELRACGRNIAQILKGINLGYAPQLSDDKELFVATHRALAEISALVHEITIACGSRLRRAAGLKPLADSEAP